MFGASRPPGVPGLLSARGFGSLTCTAAPSNAVNSENPPYRYGEPGWKVRPIDGPEIENTHLLPLGDISYEELEAGERTKVG